MSEEKHLERKKMRMKKTVVLVSMIVVVSLLMACTQAVSASLVKSDKPRITTPAATTSDMAKLVTGNTDFAFSLYQSLVQTGGNLFYSPYSISQALAMTYAGARGETEKQMAETLHFTLPQDSLHAGFNQLDLEMAKRGQGAKGKDEKGFRLNIVNAIWGQKDYSFQPAFLNTLAQNYGAGLRILDFIKAPEPSRVTINDWVSSQTETRIKDLLPQGVINKDTRLVLTNAIYFNAAWAFPFQKTSTTDGTFTNLDGKKVTVPMMKQIASFGYVKGDNYQAIELPYDLNELSMVIILPDNGVFETFEKNLNTTKVNTIINNLHSTSTEITMPLFKIETESMLSKILIAMGMPDAFSTNADFSGMTGNRDLSISEVIHKAFVAVDEAGTEAAAATGVVMTVTSMPVSSAEMTIDRPFIFLIRDIKTGAVLFVGRTVQLGN
jgi:serpin B